MTMIPPYLRRIQEEIERYAADFGLDFFPIVYEVLNYRQMNEVAAYGGFPTRYPHWRFGMEYEHLLKSHTYGLSKIYEMVVNNNPSVAYLLEGNSTVDQKMVMAHVCGHVDFFKNNYFFSKTNRKMIDGMANHAARLRRHVDRFGIDKVEGFLDVCLSLDNLIDPHMPFIRRRAEVRPYVEDVEEEAEGVPRLRAKSYMDKFINPPKVLEEERKKREKEAEQPRKFPEERQRDILLFLLENAPLEKWELDVLEIVRDEAYYFAPQAQTKILNEGWACLHPDSLVFTDSGLVTMRALVERGQGIVSDGQAQRRVYDRHVIADHERVVLRTRRGLELCGSSNHRVLLSDGATWKRLDELATGERVAVSGGSNLWASTPVALSWTPPTRVDLDDVAEQAGVSVWTVLRHRAGRHTRSDGAIAEALVPYEDPSNQALPQAIEKRAPVRLPAVVDEDLGAFLGYLVGDGHISRVKRHLGLTTGDEPQALAFADLACRLFGVMARIRMDGNRYRVLLHSEMLSDFLVQGLGLTEGPSASEKSIPEPVLRSPEPVIRAFLRAYYDCDGHAGPSGVILSTTSDHLASAVQIVLLNYGILSHRRRGQDGCWQVQVRGASAKVFAERIGFGLERKQTALARYVSDRKWFKVERWDDEIVSIDRDRGDVYDISVEETHRYVAQGFVNHNSFWHSTIMTQKALNASEIIDYAENAAGVMATAKGQLNPYKLGIELLRDIEDRWDRGRFGKEWDECDDLEARKNWDRRLALGRRKVFEVRKLYNDVTFIDEFFTEDFCRRHHFFSYMFNERSGNWEIESREFRKVKDRLLFQLTNFGQPFIYVEDGNYENRGELLLRHLHEGVDLRVDHARDTLAAMHRVWKRPVCLLSKVEGKGKLLRFDGRDHSDKAAEYK